MKTKISKIGRRGKIVLTLLVAVMFIGIASAQLLPHFGKVTTTMTTEQSIVISDDGETWKDWGDFITRNLNNGEPLVHCTDYTYKLWIKNRACVPATPTFTDDPTNPEDDVTGITINHHIFGDSQTISLRHKVVDFDNAPWAIIEDEVFADVTFNTCGTNFVYTIDYEGLDVGEEYKLIYYADVPPRWDGDGIVTVLKTFTATDSGTTSGTRDVPAMPTTDDYNSYTQIEDAYAHRYGAKLWIIPSEATDGEKIINWYSEGTGNPILWETDLALYIDCDDMAPPWLEYVYPIFDTDILQPGSTYCWISRYHVAFDIDSAIYSFDTLLDAIATPVAP